MQNNMQDYLIFCMLFLGVAKNSYNLAWDVVSTKLGGRQTWLRLAMFSPPS